MSNIKASPNLFIGVAEFNRLQKFLQDDGYVQKLKFNTKLPGIVHIREDSNLNNFKVSPGTTSGKIKIGSSALGDNYAIDIDGNVLTLPYTDDITIPVQGIYYWVGIRYLSENIEKGTVNIAADGTLTGTNTKFTEVLRGVPDHPAVIEFVDELNNTAQYQVVRVINDENAILSSGSFTPETDLRYKVVGTFTPGVTIDPSNQFIFNYDSCEIIFDAEVSSNTRPNITGLDVDRKFYLARVHWDGATLTVEDRRRDYWETRSEWLSNQIKPYKGIWIPGPESVKYDLPTTTRDVNLVTFGWGFRSTNWTIDPSTRIITINGGEGGWARTTEPVGSGNFNGHRIYNSNGGYSIITSQSKAGGTQINCVLDSFDLEDWTPGEEIVVVPDTEEIEIRVRGNADGVDDLYFQMDEILNAPVADGNITFPVKVHGLATEANPFKIFVQYRFKNGQNYGEWNDPRTPSFGHGYYDESSFDEFGELNTAPIDRNVKTYSVSGEDGYIELVAASDHYSSLLSEVVFGDKLTHIFTTLSPVITSKILTVGTDEQVQFYTGSLTMISDMVIGLSRVGAVNGNRFIIVFDMDSPIVHAGSSIQIQDNASGGGSGTLLYNFTLSDFDYCGLGNRRVSFHCFYDGNEWNLTKMEGDSAQMGEVKMQTSINLSGSFDGTGLGVTGEYVGWALCNGANGTIDLREKFVGGYDPDPGSDFNLQEEGGENEVTLDETQLAPHSHGITDPGHTHDTGQFIYASKVDGNAMIQPSAIESGSPDRPNLQDVGLIPDADTGVTVDSAGGGLAHENRPQYMALAFIQRVAT
jgi:microcystin-dependent protein